MVEREVIIENRKGVHGRVATELAKIAGTYNAAVYLIHEDQVIDCSSVLEVLSRGLIYGTEVLVRTAGEEAEGAMAAVEKLLSRRDDP